jgi:1,4-alpha-glucan branching enzyme
MPYVRLSEKWPHGEEWIHEAITETYIPLIGALNQLRKEDVRFQLTLGITPILAEQLADELVLTNFASYLQNKIAVLNKITNVFIMKANRNLHNWHIGITHALATSCVCLSTIYNGI